MSQKTNSKIDLKKKSNPEILAEQFHTNDLSKIPKTKLINAVYKLYQKQLDKMVPPYLLHKEGEIDAEGITNQTFLIILSDLDKYKSFDELDIAITTNQAALIKVAHTKSFQNKYESELRLNNIQKDKKTDLQEIVVDHSAIDLENMTFLTNKEIADRDAEKHLKDIEIEKKTAKIFDSAEKVLNPFDLQVFNLHHKEHKNIREIASKLNRKLSVVYSALLKSQKYINYSDKNPEWNGPRNNNQRSFTQNKSQETIQFENKIICRAYSIGINVGKIAERFKMTRNAVRAIVKTSVEAEDIKRKRENAYLKSIGFSSWDERKRELLNAYTAGTSINELIHIFKIGKKKIHNIAKNEPNGEEITRQRKVSQQNIKLEKITHRNLFITRAYGFGIDIHKIAARVKLDKDNVYKIASNSEIAVENRKQAKLRNNHLTETQKRYQVIYRAYGLGIDAKTIADKFGFSKNTIHNIVQSSPHSQAIYQNRAEAKQRGSLNPIRKPTPEERRLGAIYHAFARAVDKDKICERFGLKNQRALKHIISSSDKKKELLNCRKIAQQEKKNILAQEMAKKFGNNISVQEIAKESGYDEATVFSMMATVDGYDKAKINKKIEKEMQFANLYQKYIDNIPLSTIAQEEGYKSANHVATIIKRSKIKELLHEKKALSHDDENKSFNLRQSLEEFYFNNEEITQNLKELLDQSQITYSNQILTVN